MAFTIAKGYVAKAPLDNPASQMTKVVEWISSDGGAMLPVKHKEGLDLIKEVNADIKAAKCKKPLLKLGTDSGDLVLRVEGEGKYVKDAVLVKGYVKLLAERAKATIVNADKGDKTIDQATRDLAKIKNTKGETADDVNLNAKGSTAPIVILAHGSPTGKVPGTVYAKDFANKKPGEIVSYLVGTKKLDKKYAGVIYLDGCYTAAGPKQGRDKTESNNYAKKVYDELVKAGYKYLQVKGNLGAAATMGDGSESVLDAQEEARHNARLKEIKKLKDELTKTSEVIQARADKLEKVALALTAKHKGNAESLKADAGIGLVKGEVEKLEKERTAAAAKLAELAAEKKKIKAGLEVGGEYDIKDLVGVFGPEKLASRPWYKKLFG